MKIGILVYSLFEIGGAQRLVSRVASELCKNSEVIIIYFEDKSTINYKLHDLDERVKIECLNSKIQRNQFRRAVLRVNRVLGFLDWPLMSMISRTMQYSKKELLAWEDYINSLDFDILIATEFNYSILLGLLTDKLNCKTIGWQLNSYNAYYNSPGYAAWGLKKIARDAYSKLNAMVVLIDADKIDYLKSMKLETRVIYNPKSYISNEKSNMENKRFLAVGTYKPAKGFPRLVESFYEFSKMNSDWNLIILGKGTGTKKETKIIEGLVKKYDLENKIILEPSSNSTKSYFLQSSVFLLSSSREGMPMVILEALEMGTPIIAYSIEAMGSLVDNGVEGFLIDKFNVKEFAKCMEKIASDDTLREHMSKATLKRSDMFEIKNIIMEWNELFDEVMGENK